RLPGDEHGPLAGRAERLQLVAARQLLDDEATVLREDAQLLRSDEAERIAARPADGRLAGVALLEDRDEVDDRKRRVEAGRGRLRDGRAGLRIGPDVLEHQPAVEAGEVVGVRQPDVDDREPAGAEVAGEPGDRLALAAPRREEEQGVQG